MKITQEQRDLFNPYKNVSLIFKKKLQEKDNCYVSFNSEIKFDEENLSEENFRQNLQLDITDISSDPIKHRNNIHPVANNAMQNCKLNLVLLSGEDEWVSRNPQTIRFTNKDGRYTAFLFAKVRQPSHFSDILSAIEQSSTLSIKVDLLCDDSVFTKLEQENTVQVIVHALSISFNLPDLELITPALS